MSPRLYDQAAPDPPEDEDPPEAPEPDGSEDLDADGNPLEAEASTESPADAV